MDLAQAQVSENPPKKKAYKGVAMEGLIAKWYSKTQEKSIEQYRSWAKLASSHISEESNVLEVAPGPGYLSVELAKLGDYKVVGLDISRTFVKLASERARKVGVNVEFRQGDAAQIPFHDGTFDFVICTSAFKNFPEPVIVLDEIFRVLRSGGEGVIIDLRKDASMDEINEYVDDMKLSCINSFVTKFIFKRMLLKSAYTRGEIEDFASKSKFGDCRILDETIGFEAWFKKP